MDRKLVRYFGLLSVVVVMNCLIWSAAFCQETTSGSDSATSREASETQAGRQLIYTLPECVDRGLKENPKIRAAESDVLRAGSDIGAQRGNFFPTLTASTFKEELQSLQAKGLTDQDYLDQDIWSVNLRVSQTLFQGLIIFNTYQKAIIAEELARAQKNQAEMDLILDIQTNFLKLLKATQDVRSLQSAVERLEINEKSAKAFYEKQMTPYLSVLQSKVDLADAQEQLSQAKNVVETQQVMMNLLLGIPVETPVVYEGQPSPEVRDVDFNLGTCLDCAYQNRPEVKVAAKSVEMAEKELAIQRGRFSPRISANYDYIIRNTDYKYPGYSLSKPYDRDQENTYWTAMIQMQWDFNFGGQQFYQQARAQHDMERLIHHRKDVKDQISAQVRTSFLKLIEAKSRIENSGSALEAAQESYDRAKKWSQVQMGTISDLLDIQARLTRAEANRNNAVSDYQLSLANLCYSMGRRNDGLTELPQGLTEPVSGVNSN